MLGSHCHIRAGGEESRPDSYGKLRTGLTFSFKGEGTWSLSHLDRGRGEGKTVTGALYIRWPGSRSKPVADEGRGSHASAQKPAEGKTIRFGKAQVREF